MNQHSRPVPALDRPKLILQAFHLFKSRTKVEDAEVIWDRLADLAHPLNIPDLKKLPKLTQPERDRLGKLAEGAANSYSSEDRQQLGVPLLPDLKDNTLQIDIPASLISPSVKGGIYPALIHDSYAIDLTRCYDESQFDKTVIGKRLNPEGCLLPSSVRASIGQTLILFGTPVYWPEDEAEFLEVAKSFALALFQDAAPRDRPELHLSGRGKFLGGSILEFESEHPNPTLRIHILVWLDNQQTATLEAQGDYYHPMLQLWLSRSKIQWSAHRVNLAYKLAGELYEEMEKTTQDFDDISAKQSNAQRLNILEGKLLELPRKTLEYAKRIRDVQHQLTTIEINTENFRNYLNRLQDVGIEGVDDLAFLERFLSRDCQTYRKQAIFNLDYLATGRSLFDQTIATIRGLVEIDRGRVEIDRGREEQDRSRKLTIVVAAVGAGLSVTSISAGIRPNAVKSLQQVGLNFNADVFGRIVLYFSTLAIHAAVGILIGIAVWWILGCVAERFRGKQ